MRWYEKPLLTFCAVSLGCSGSSGGDTSSGLEDAAREDTPIASDTSSTDGGVADTTKADTLVADTDVADTFVSVDSGTDSGTADTGDVSTTDTTPVVKRVFVTSSTYNANLAKAAGTTNGLEGGDKLCNLVATAASLGGTWKAWLSSSKENAFDRIKDVGPWFLVDGKTKVFANKASLAVRPLVAPHMTETGGRPKNNVWTGTTNTGVSSGFTCRDWTNEAFGEGGNGISSSVSYWTEVATNPCGNEDSLYCFEQ